MKILITGVAGFIGFHLAKSLVEQGHKIIGIDNINNYYDIQLILDRLSDLGISEKSLNWYNPVKRANSTL